MFFPRAFVVAFVSLVAGGYSKRLKAGDVVKITSDPLQNRRETDGSGTEELEESFGVPELGDLVEDADGYADDYDRIRSMKGCFEKGVGYTGKAIPGKHKKKSSSAENCQKKCRQEAACQFFTWWKSSKRCYLKTSVSKKKRQASVSGPRECKAQSPQRQDKDYQYQNNQIVCPVLAQLHRIGALKADADGNTEISQLFVGLHYGAGIEKQLSLFQSFGIVGFPPEQKNIEEVRDRCAPFNARGKKCFNDRLNLNITDDPANFRFLNLFKMNGKQTLEHGISTGVRGGGVNMPPGALDACNGVFPCEALFQKFFLQNANPDGNFYEEDLMKIVCLARAEGDRGGEHSYRSGSMYPAVPFSQVAVDSEEWQMKGAMTAMLQAYGRRDGNNVLYMTSDDMRQMMMLGMSPSGWQKRPNGCIEPQPGCERAATERWTTPVGQCSTPLHGEFWKSQSSCKTVSGDTCATDSDCNTGKGLMCYNGRCTCKRGVSGTQTCWSRRSRACHEDPTRSSCSMWGQPCRVYKATNPEAPGN